MKKIKVTVHRGGRDITFLRKDTGKPGKTPKSQQWYSPSVETGWRKEMGEEERRRLVLNAHKGDRLAAARAMQALVNVSTDKETRKAARADAMHFYAEHRTSPPGIMGGSRRLRITPKTPRLR